MNGKQSRRCRAYANAEIKRRALWDEGINQVKGKWFKKLTFTLFPKYRSRMIDLVSRWYKRNLKNFAKQYAAALHDPLIQSYAKARQKEERKRLKKTNGRPVLIRAPSSKA
jgi:hypothetical protein